MNRNKGRPAVASRLLDPGRLLRYAVAGSSAALVHLATVIGLVEVFAMPPYAASSIAFLFIATPSFMVQHRWVYRSTQPMCATGPRFLLVAGLAFLVNGVTVYLGTRSTTVHYGLVQIVAFILIPVSNYVAHTLWSFASERPGRRRPHQEGQHPW